MQDRSYYCFEFFHFGDKMNAYIYTYLNRNVIEFSDKSMFDPINKIFRRYNGNQIGADHIKMLCKDKNVINVKRGCQGFSFWQMEKKALCLTVNTFTMKVLIKDLFLRLQLETGPPFSVVIRVTWKSSRLHCKGSTFISQLF